MCGVPVRDPVAAYAFYTETLGFIELLTMPEAGLYIVRSPEDPDGVGLLLEPNGDHPIVAPYKDGLYEQQIPIMVLGSTDVRREYDRLVALGVRFTGEPVTDQFGTTAVFDDTCGNYVQIHQD